MRADCAQGCRGMKCVVIKTMVSKLPILPFLVLAQC